MAIVLKLTWIALLFVFASFYYTSASSVQRCPNSRGFFSNEENPKFSLYGREHWSSLQITSEIKNNKILLTIKELPDTFFKGERKNCKEQEIKDTIENVIIKFKQYLAQFYTCNPTNKKSYVCEFDLNDIFTTTKSNIKTDKLLKQFVYVRNTKSDDIEIINYIFKLDFNDFLETCFSGKCINPFQKIYRVNSKKFYVESYFPSNWTCPEEFYNASDGCDCDCGAYDPDCDNPDSDSDIYNCYSGIGASCNATGQCQYQVPEWDCDLEFYNASDGCDCDCGAYDPDCDNPYAPVFNCDNNDEICLPEGICSTYYSNIPKNWTCLSENYNASDGCDCNCGAYDPDCDTPNEVFNCPCTNMTCYNGYCVGSCKGLFLTATEEKNKDNTVIGWSILTTTEEKNKNTAVIGWSVAFATLLTLNVISIIVVVLYRKRGNRTNDKRSYILLETK